MRSVDALRRRQMLHNARRKAHKAALWRHPGTSVYDRIMDGAERKRIKREQKKVAEKRYGKIVKPTMLGRVARLFRRKV